MTDEWTPDAQGEESEAPATRPADDTALATDEQASFGVGNSQESVPEQEADEAALESMAPVVREMHGSSGLTEEIRSSTVTVAQAEKAVLDYVREWVPVSGAAPLAGNSIGTDRRFLARYMPELDTHLHYRMIDVSSIKELCRRWYPRIYFGQPEKGMNHRALADIAESIRELAYYRRAAFVQQPGPTGDEVREAAESLPTADEIARGADFR